MGFYRKKPVVIEAMQFTGGFESAYAIQDWANSVGVGRDPDRGYYLKVLTFEGVMEAHPGDWIIRGVKGEFYPCKPDIFEATYDEAPEGGNG